MGIINNSPSPITINYRGVLGTPSSDGCGPNYKTVPSTCTVAANGGTRTLNLGESSGDQAQGTITIITHSGQILYDYMLTGERQRLDWILPENPKNKLIPYMQAYVDGPCNPMTHYNCIIYTNKNTQKNKSSKY